MPAWAKCWELCNAVRTETNQRAGKLPLSTSFLIEKKTLARTDEISHLRVSWVAAKRTRFGSSHILLFELLLSGKEQSARRPCRGIPWLLQAALIQSDSVFI